MDSPSKLRRKQGVVNSENLQTSQPKMVLFVVVLIFLGDAMYVHTQNEQHAKDEPEAFVRAALGAEQNRSEFFLSGADLEERFPRFDFTLTEPDDDFGQLEPMWRCEDSTANQGRKRKLVFNHIFKTAGSTMRSILQAYSVVCNAGIAIVVGCTSLSFDSINDGTWRNGVGRRDGNKCRLKQFRSRNGANVSKPPDNSISTRLLETDVDILAGHLPMGSDYGWKDGAGAQVDAQYVVFLRDGVHKYVSGILFKNPDKNEREIVHMIKERVRDQRKEGKYYEKYSSYLISPEQSHKFREAGISPSVEQRANLTMSNMVRYNVLVGIVERMSESLEIIRFVIDGGDELRGMFEFFGMANRNGTAVNRFGVVNKSKLSSSKIVTELEKDANFMKDLREYVKYDDMIRDFGLKLHRKQYEYIRSKQLTPSPSPPDKR